MKSDDAHQDMLDRLAMRTAAVVGTVVLVTWCVIVVHFVVKYW
jgi:succinate dehydrogenase hydrophobic anchor subunit